MNKENERRNGNVSGDMRKREVKMIVSDSEVRERFERRVK